MKNKVKQHQFINTNNTFNNNLYSKFSIYIFECALHYKQLKFSSKQCFASQKGTISITAYHWLTILHATTVLIFFSLIPGLSVLTAESRNVSPNTTDPRVYPGCSMLGMSYKYRQTLKKRNLSYSSSSFLHLGKMK